MVKGMGGAMNLWRQAKHIIVAMQHCSKEGAFQALKKCTLPLTLEHKRIVSDLAVSTSFRRPVPAGSALRPGNQRSTKSKKQPGGKLVVEGEIPGNGIIKLLDNY